MLEKHTAIPYATLMTVWSDCFGKNKFLNFGDSVLYLTSEYTFGGGVVCSVIATLAIQEFPDFSKLKYPNHHSALPFFYRILDSLHR